MEQTRANVAMTAIRDANKETGSRQRGCELDQARGSQCMGRCDGMSAQREQMRTCADLRQCARLRSTRLVARRGVDTIPLSVRQRRTAVQRLRVCHAALACVRPTAKFSVVFHGAHMRAD